MVYRDELAAALARIEALERQLVTAEAPDPALRELQLANHRLAAEVKQMKRDHDLATRELELMREQRYGAPSPGDVSQLPSLVEHNRQFATPALRSAPAGVLCPTCLASGDRIEMLRVSVAAAPEMIDHAAVACPRCATVGMLRTR